MDPFVALATGCAAAASGVALCATVHMLNRVSQMRDALAEHSDRVERRLRALVALQDRIPDRMADVLQELADAHDQLLQAHTPADWREKYPAMRADFAADMRPVDEARRLLASYAVVRSMTRLDTLPRADLPVSSEQEG